MEKQVKKKLSRSNVSNNEKTENTNESNLNDDDECSNNDVELPFDVVTIIFKNLNAKDLHVAAMVCRLWNEAAENEKRVRNDRVSVLTSHFDDSWADIDRFADELRTKPLLGLMFTRPFDKNHPATKKDKTDCPCRYLPSNCANVIVGNWGVVSETNEMEDKPEKATWTLLPWDKDVTVEIVSFGREKKKLRVPYRREITQLDEAKVAMNKARCFVAFEAEDTEGLEMFVFEPRAEQCVSGSVVHNLVICKHDKNEKICRKIVDWVGISISGPTVISWCVVLNKHCKTKNKIMAKLELLKSQVRLRKHAVGFMFACVGRGESMFRDKNVESTAFKQLFPNVPLIGGFGSGEFGLSTVEPEQNQQAHQYSTVFTILTYGT